MLYEIIGTNIKRARKERGMTQSELAERLRISPQMISRYENGTAAVDIEMLSKLSLLFGVSLDRLCGLDEDAKERRVRSLVEKYFERREEAFGGLYDRYAEFLSEADGLLGDDRVMEIQLLFLEALHDSVENEQQHREINEKLFECASRILDLSQEDRLRSLANYRMALYYWETPMSSPDYKRNLELSKEYLSRVLLCTYFPDYTPVIGTDASREVYHDSKVANIQFFIRKLHKMLHFISRKSEFSEANEVNKELLAVLDRMV